MSANYRSWRVTVALFCCAIALNAAGATLGLNPTLTVSPTVPSPTDTVALTLNDITGYPALIDSSSVTINGSVIEIDAQITLGTFDELLYYTLTEQLSALPEGRYTVRYVAQVRQFTPDYSPPTLINVWEFVVLGPGKVASAVEYYYGRLDHYFVTAIASEISALDSSVFPGWVRTGQTINVVTPESAGAGFGPVCRFYGLPSAGLDSHFYSASPEECAAVLARFPDAWILESFNVFGSYLPDLNTGRCPINLMPVYRVYDNRADANHRYTTSSTIRNQMVSLGWLPEGYGPNAVAMCAP